MSRPWAQVLIVQERLPHYRVPFFEQLREHLHRDDIDLAVVHGEGTRTDAARGDEGALPWAHVVSNRSIPVGQSRIVWQPVTGCVNGVDLVIVEQASRLVVNYPLLTRQALGGPRIAFWGHGANLQAGPSLLSRFSETVKTRYSRRPHWWFAYTEGSARRVEALGFDPDRITVVQNAVDTRVIEATTADRDNQRCIYVGGLYTAKRLDLVFAAADILAKAVPGFSLAIVGAGELSGYVQSEAARRSYVDYLGAKFGRELAVELRRSSAMLMPGAVGLGVLDAFAAALPVITAAGTGHGPEFEYLTHGDNGLVAEPTPMSLADATLVALDPCKSARFRHGACQASTRFTLDNMVNRFGAGIRAACDLQPSSTVR